MTRPRRSTTTGGNEERPVLLAPREQVERELDERIRLGEGLAAATINNREEDEAQRSDYYNWHEYNKELLTRRFSTSALADEYTHVAPFIAGGNFRDLAP